MKAQVPAEYVSSFDTRPLPSERSACLGQYYWALYLEEFTRTGDAGILAFMLDYATEAVPYDAPKPVPVPWHAWMPGWLFILVMAIPVLLIRLGRKLAGYML